MKLYISLPKIEYHKYLKNTIAYKTEYITEISVSTLQYYYNIFDKNMSSKLLTANWLFETCHLRWAPPNFKYQKYMTVALIISLTKK